ncbi:MAG: type II toxin-antitoxin system death-on-curing family toxin [Actinomycetota bacterium]
MRYLIADEVITISETEVGKNLLAHRGLLESALARPQQTVFGEDAYPSIHEKAAALMESLIRNHPFLDGNKRTAVIATLIFYGFNGMWLEALQEDVTATAVDVAKGLLDLGELARRLGGWAHPIAR